MESAWISFFLSFSFFILAEASRLRGWMDGSWDRCNQDSVWRELEVRTSVYLRGGTPQHAEDDRGETRRSAFRGMHSLSARRTHWRGGYEQNSREMHGHTGVKNSRRRKWKGIRRVWRAYLGSCASCDNGVFPCCVRAECLRRMSNSREDCLHAGGAHGAHSVLPIRQVPVASVPWPSQTRCSGVGGRVLSRQV